MAAAETPATRKDAQTSVSRPPQGAGDRGRPTSPTLAARRRATPSARAAENAVTDAEANLAAAIDWNQQMQAATDGQILFQNNCARCHTRGWSYFDPNEPLSNPLPSPMGSGAFGPNLTEGDVDRQFPPPTGESELFSWISIGVRPTRGTASAASRRAACRTSGPC